MTGCILRNEGGATQWSDTGTVWGDIPHYQEASTANIVNTMIPTKEEVGVYSSATGEIKDNNDVNRYCKCVSEQMCVTKGVSPLHDLSCIGVCKIGDITQRDEETEKGSVVVNDEDVVEPAVVPIPVVVVPQTAMVVLRTPPPFENEIVYDRWMGNVNSPVRNVLFLGQKIVAYLANGECKMLERFFGDDWNAFQASKSKSKFIQRCFNVEWRNRYAVDCARCEKCGPDSPFLVCHRDVFTRAVDTKIYRLCEKHTEECDLEFPNGLVIDVEEELRWAICDALSISANNHLDVEDVVKGVISQKFSRMSIEKLKTTRAVLETINAPRFIEGMDIAEAALYEQHWRRGHLEIFKTFNCFKCQTAVGPRDKIVILLNERVPTFYCEACSNKEEKEEEEELVSEDEEEELVSEDEDDTTSSVNSDDYGTCENCGPDSKPLKYDGELFARAAGIFTFSSLCVKSTQRNGMLNMDLCSVRNARCLSPMMRTKTTVELLARITS